MVIQFAASIILRRFRDRQTSLQQPQKTGLYFNKLTVYPDYLGPAITRFSA